MSLEDDVTPEREPMRCDCKLVLCSICHPVPTKLWDLTESDKQFLRSTKISPE